MLGLQPLSNPPNHKSGSDEVCDAGYSKNLPEDLCIQVTN